MRTTIRLAVNGFVYRDERHRPEPARVTFYGDPEPGTLFAVNDDMPRSAKLILALGALALGAVIVYGVLWLSDLLLLRKW